MLWMGICLHPYTLSHDMVLGSFWKITVRPGLNDVSVSWLRLQTVRANANANEVEGKLE